MKFNWQYQVAVHAAVLFLLMAGRAEAVSIQFNQATLKTYPGDTVNLVTSLSAPVANGLEGYALKMEFPEGVLSLSISEISVPTALDFGLVDPGAVRDVGFGFTYVTGYVELGQSAYTGTEFAVFTITIPEGTPEGNYTLKLAPLLDVGVNFVDGLGNPLDDSMTFGQMNLEVGSLRPAEYIDTFKVGILSGQVMLTFYGMPGWPYTIQALDDPDSGWYTLEVLVVPQGSGRVTVFDPTGLSAKARFYRILASDILPTDQP